MCYMCQGLDQHTCQKCGRRICTTHRDYLTFAHWKRSPVICTNCGKEYRDVPVLRSTPIESPGTGA